VGLRLHIGRRRHARVMAKLDQPARPMMRRPAGLSPTRHRRQRSKTPAACCSGSPWRPRRVLKQKLPLSGVSSLLSTLSFAKRYRSAGLRPRRLALLKKFAVGPVKSILHSQRNGGFGTHFGPSRGAPRRRAIGPTGTCSAAICYVRSTSTPAGRNAKIAVARCRRACYATVISPHLRMSGRK
jgi:hypothetical protein